jgi:hypothetical protein
MSRIPNLLLAALTLGHGSLAAQTCLGRPDLAAGGGASLAAASSFLDRGLGFGAEVTAGGRVFLQSAFDYYRFANTDLALKSVGGSLGVVVPTRTDRVNWCPRVALSHSFGVELYGAPFTAMDFSPSVSMGVAVDVSPHVVLTSYGQFALVYTRVSVDIPPVSDDFMPRAPSVGHENARFAVFTAGLGTTFLSELTVSPSVSLPVGHDGAGAVLRVAVSVPVAR